MLRTALLFLVLLVSAASSAQAQVTIPHEFTNGDAAEAAEVTPTSRRSPMHST